MALFESIVKGDKEYQSHKIFALLRSLVKFYNAVFMLGPDFPTKGVCGVMINVDNVICGSLAGTLDSIKIVLKAGRINDAYALMRKYYDGIIVAIYTNVYIAENHSWDHYVVEKIQDWVKNKQKLPSSEKMLEAIRKHKPLEDLEKLFDYEGLYLRIRRLANGNTHYNKMYYLWLNNNMIYNPNRMRSLDSLYTSILNLFILHFAYMYSLNPHYMMSSDYFDALDCGMTPMEGSQYWVATHVADVFKKYVAPNRPDVAEYMRECSEMEL